MYKSNEMKLKKQAGMKSELFENHTIIEELSWYNIRAIRKSKHY